ncbi:indolepyruvate ferredoxin oxidoreductase family protein [Novosphingobium album (ex Liu et al. 2023)]|uniref:Indolepyruvate ferredoxin oxidoreductase family protein n=1 Tax=Novosphingobium album (ex Liu et al. 2023) TaxID=3031130 RepID=A0ABT5WVW8_9SPHN|nr:indolepyruvate ferredoxin oxidoreductase family protein [Novosphingobium album (ex Liu et al. 2023)]MDE8654002.1 indolepyruvate ferredoxin oxidoreductase family protein [Novosphingobium album (ex Liu et al. 2023)]
MTRTVVTLDDKYTQGEGQVMLSALQGVVRLLLDQSRRDAAAGLGTAGYVTGYRGSPITTLDAQLWAAQTLLDAHDIRFEPGLNEELAATSLRGTQQLDWYGKPRVDGVFALWYAKGVGVERAGEAIKAANFEGTHRNGGALLLCGDDHAAKSSLTAHQSEHVLVTAMVPVLYPATTDEILSMGQLGWALSRASGLYVGLKAVTDTLDLTTTVTLPGHAFPIAMPELPPGSSPNLRIAMSALQQEQAVIEQRLPIVPLFASLNRLDRVTQDAPDRRLTVVSAGKAWLDVCQALADLGLGAARCRAIGLRVVKLGLVWPVDAGFLREACGGSGEVLVIEEKRAFIEDQIARIFYGRADAPALSGKTAPDGTRLLAEIGVLDPGTVRRALVQRLATLGLLPEEAAARDAALREMEGGARLLALTAIRPAYFCSGCPHNTSTLVPEGSAAMGATGCHGLAHYMPERHTMQTVSMGQEGMPWVAAQSFVDTPHMFQNLGDGTYTHSGLLTIRAAVAAKSRVTFKILYNDAVAMTGGQPAEGALSPEQIVRELVIEGVWPVVLVSEDPSRFADSPLPSGVRVRHRDELDAVQRELREVNGTSGIVYEQTCANEKRRRRKKGQYPDPDKRLFINTAVCEGCGDCSVQSNCLSVTPVETEFGRKRAIDQSTCNKDYSCIKGFCPSFVEVSGAGPARRDFDAGALAAMVARLPAPPVLDVVQAPRALLVTGIGGTGVLTVGAILAMAAHLEGKAVKVLDQTGMAQKGGAVTSHIRIGADMRAIPSARLGTGQADVIIACDLVVGSAPDVLALARPDTHVLANEDVVPTGEFQRNRDLDLTVTRFLAAIGKRVDPARIAALRAGSLATRLLGDSIFTNLMMVGFAAQKGLLPVGLDAIEEAIRLNGIAAKANLAALALGRLAADGAADLFDLADAPAHQPAFPVTLADVTESRARLLAAYQNPAWAADYRAFLDDIAGTLAARGLGECEALRVEIARGLGKLMAYKDEYEVARLYSDPAFRAQLADAFAGSPRLKVHLAPPLLAWRKDARTGRPRKIAFGGWIFPVFGLLARLKGLRGTAFDPFGHTAERRLERALIGEYKDLVRDIAARVTPATLPVAIQLAAAPELVAGYGPVKDAGIAAYRARVAEGLPRLEPAPAPPAAALAREPA